MPTITFNCNKQQALKIIKEHTGDADDKIFNGSVDADGFTIWRNKAVRDLFKVKAKGKVENNEEGGAVISLTFTQNMLLYLFLAFVAIAIISLTSVMSFFEDGAMLYAIQVLTVSVLGIVAMLSYYYQMNKIMSAIEGLK